jgi:hypothetical protein
LAITIVGALFTISLSVLAQGGAGFQPLHGWVAESGAQVSSQGDTFLLRDGTIRTNRLYSDFVLRFEFRFSEPASTGHLPVCSRFGYGVVRERGYRITLTDKPDGRDALGRVSAAEVKMKEVAFQPVPVTRPVGEWHECEIRAERDTLIVRVNGALVTLLNKLETNACSASARSASPRS